MSVPCATCTLRLFVSFHWKVLSKATAVPVAEIVGAKCAFTTRLSTQMKFNVSQTVPRGLG